MEIDVVFWYWWVVAVFMLGIEMLSPGFLFLWMAISGFIVGLLVLVFPSLDIQMQLFIFSILSVVSVFAWKRYMMANPIQTDHPYLNQRTQGYVGHRYYLVEAIENGVGRIKIDDTLWEVEGEDCPIKSRVEIIATDGSSFQVELVD